MIVDEYGQTYYDTKECIEYLYNQEINPFDAFLSDHEEISKYNSYATHFDLDTINHHSKPKIDAIEYHKLLSKNWQMPQEYLDIDRDKVLIDRMEEMNINQSLYLSYLHNEIQYWEKIIEDPKTLWKFLYFLMETCENNGIITGVGRGSSVSSLVLYLLGVHHIDPVKYSLDYNEFLR